MLTKAEDAEFVAAIGMGRHHRLMTALGVLVAKTSLVDRADLA